MEENLVHLEELFERHREYGVIINPSKCVFGQHQVKFLVFGSSTEPLPIKVDTIWLYTKSYAAVLGDAEFL